MYRDAKEELKRLEEALLEEENQQADTEQWDFDIDIDDIPEPPQKQNKQKKDNRNRIIFALTIAVIILTAAMVGLVAFLLAGYGRWF